MVLKQRTSSWESLETLREEVFPQSCEWGLTCTPKAQAPTNTQKSTKPVIGNILTTLSVLVTLKICKEANSPTLCGSRGTENEGHPMLAPNHSGLNAQNLKLQL